MKKILIIAVFVLFITVAFGTVALAGGDQVRGCIGVGDVNQNQEEAQTWVDFSTVCDE